MRPVTLEEASKPIQSLRAFEERWGGVARLAGWSQAALSGLGHVGSPVK
jgi:hypothetical protein